MNAVVVISLPSLIAGDITPAGLSSRFVACVGRSLMIFVVYYHRFPVNFTVRRPMLHGPAALCRAKLSRPFPSSGGPATLHRQLKRFRPACAQRILSTRWFFWPGQG
ncbi:hypothetical protein PA01_18520 [Azoarcus sp. PA01]|nr:hypothetical protein PA01_18520 [Azoarcus sp. PA01]